MTIKTILRMGVNRLGFGVVRFHNSPGCTLLGMVNRDIRTVIHVGANEGQFARMASAMLPKAEFYCFEPLEEPFERLSTWAATRDGRVRCFQVALGDTEGEAAMHLHEEHTPSSSLLSITEHCRQTYPQTTVERMTRVQVSTLDRVLGDALNRMPRDILLKLDVQGFKNGCYVGESMLPRRREHACWRSVWTTCTRNRRTFAPSRSSSPMPGSTTRGTLTKSMARMGERCLLMPCL